MARRIQSPGVQITEFDYSERPPLATGTSVFVTGFADQGPTDEINFIQSINDFTNLYGAPTNAAERYFYHTVKGVLNSNATVITNRMPYGSGGGDGFGSYYTALVYPTKLVNPSLSGTTGITSNLNAVSGVYFLGAPKSLSLTKSEYESIIDGTAFNWSATATELSGLSALSTLGSAGVIVLNERQTAIDQSFQGYYIGLADNFDADNQNSDFNKIRNIKTVTNVGTGSGITNFIDVPTTTLAFQITSLASANVNSLARSIETGSDGYIIGNRLEFDDVLNVGIYKLTNSVFQDDPTKLVYALQELYTGSATNNFRQVAAPTGGEPVTYSLQTIVGNRSPNATMLINPYINNVASDSVGRGSSYDTNSQYITLKKVRLLTQTLVDGVSSATLSASIGFSNQSGVSGGWGTIINQLSTSLGLADSIYPLGTYNPVGNTNLKVIGNVPTKVEKSLGKVKDPEIFDVDVLVEGGLGTIYTFTTIASTSAYDDTISNSTFTTELSELQGGLVTSNDILTNYQAVANKFLELAQPEKDGGRGDTFFVADPIRQFFITGANSKLIDKTSSSNNYQKIYYALRNLYSNYDTSYAGAYPNWLAVIDDVTGLQTWVPPSGFVAAIMANTDAGTGPWEAPAGFNRGIIRGVVDVAWNPNQRQRDDLYKISLNPIASFPGQGTVVYGQKTLQNKPSAFDRINVRRNFLFMEKTVKDIMKFFVFEPNTKFTRDRVLATLNPFFINIQANGGLYDFLVVCDERNNSDATIEDNTLVVDIYLKPTRTAEFILVNFYATRQSASFEELVARA